MQLKTLFFFLLITTSRLFGQCPTAPMEFLTQADVNAFPTTYPGCTIIPDGVDIKIMGNNITDLTPLQQLTTVLGAFEIRNCPNLVDLDGLENITKIGNDPLDGFILRDLPNLINVTALSNLDSITGEFTIRTCNQLASLTGFNSLVYNNGSVIIRDNASLTSLSGLNSLSFIGETLEIVENAILTDITALSNVDTIVGGIEGGVFIEANDLLASLDGLGHANTEIGSNLDILLNGDLSLCSVPSLCKYLAAPPVGAIITISGNTTGCNTQAEIQSGCAILSVKDNQEMLSNLIISPNPFSEYLMIESTENTQIIISDLIGRTEVVYVKAGINRLSTNHLASGIYFIKSANGKTSKLIKP